MKYCNIPHTRIKVSKICLGSMTWGNQNTEKEGHYQLDYAIDHGINFIDTAELYPVPASAENQGKTSEIIGNWIKKRGNRSDLILASKIAGPGDYTKHIRTSGFKSTAIVEAIDMELKRLKTDYIDLYQLHWPERQTNTFGSRDFVINTQDQWEDNFEEVLRCLNEQQIAGKIRAIGLSNEKAWGTMRFVEESRKENLSKISTIQNAYSLLNRTFEGDLAEVSFRENIGLLAYSPLGFGVLTGKYIKGTASDNSRLRLFPRFARYSSEQCTNATLEYMKLAESLNISITELALAFVNQRPFVTSNIIGATTMNQLKENIDSIDIKLTEEMQLDIEDVHLANPNPCV